MNIKELLNLGIKGLNESYLEDSKMASKMLLANILSCRKEELIINFEKEVKLYQEKRFLEQIEKVKNGYPVQYIIGKKEFMKMSFFVNEDVLIPRADTEVLVEEVISIGENKKNILELCTGSGAISISISKYLENAKIVATDISENALKVAKQNFESLAPNAKIDFIKSDMFQNIQGKFEIIVSNPPYIKTSVIKDYNLKYEPKIALDGGEDGLKFYRTIIGEGYKYLSPEGIIILEIGYDQRRDVYDIVKDSGKYKGVSCKKDLFGNDRVILIQG